MLRTVWQWLKSALRGLGDLLTLREAATWLGWWPLDGAALYFVVSFMLTWLGGTLQGGWDPIRLWIMALLAATLVVGLRTAVLAGRALQKYLGAPTSAVAPATDQQGPIPCRDWASMSVIPRWIGYAGFAHDEYPSATHPHMTGPRGDKWICWGHLRVSSEEIKRRWPPRLVATGKADATAPTYWTATEAITWIAFGRAITQEESKQTAIDEFLNEHPEEEKVALNRAEAELFEKLRSQSMKALGKEGNSEKYSDIPHTVFLSKVGINILHNTIGMDWGADLATRERWDLSDWRDVKVWRSDVLRFWPQPGTTPYEEFVPLPEAARIAFEETGAVDAVIRTGTPEERLAYHANAIIDDDLRDALLAIYGVRPPGRKRQRVPKKELKYSLSNDLLLSPTRQGGGKSFVCAEPI